MLIFQIGCNSFFIQVSKTGILHICALDFAFDVSRNADHIIVRQFAFAANTLRCINNSFGIQLTKDFLQFFIGEYITGRQLGQTRLESLFNSFCRLFCNRFFRRHFFHYGFSNRFFCRLFFDCRLSGRFFCRLLFHCRLSGRFFYRLLFRCRLSSRFFCRLLFYSRFFCRSRCFFLSLYNGFRCRSRNLFLHFLNRFRCRSGSFFLDFYNGFCCRSRSFFLDFYRGFFHNCDCLYCLTLCEQFDRDRHEQHGQSKKKT